MAHHFSCSNTAASRATTAPPTTSLWPLMYLVVECTTTSAPSSKGCCSAGDRNVLSTTSSAPTACAACATWRMSVIRSSGFDGVSTHTSAGLRARPAASATLSVRSANSTWKRPFFAHASSSRQVPP